MPKANLFEHADKIRNKITNLGRRNPRFVTAVNEAKNRRMWLKDLAGDFTVFSKAKIKREYTDERVEALLAAAQKNLKNMTTPNMRQGWFDEYN